MSGSTAPFRTERYAALNKLRWAHFISMGIPLTGKTVFEPGAGIGDQTAWLLEQAVEHVYVNDGRPANMEIIRERFDSNSRLTFVPGDLESCLSQFEFHVDFVFCYGVYYHLRESFPDWHIMRGFARIGDAIALDYLVGEDTEVDYGYENPSTSLSQKAFRPRTETLLNALKTIWGYAYLPANQLEWVDPVVPETRLVAVASRTAMDNPSLIFQ